MKVFVKGGYQEKKEYEKDSDIKQNNEQTKPRSQNKSIITEKSQNKDNSEKISDDEYFSFICKQLQAKNISPEAACNMIIFRIMKVAYKNISFDSDCATVHVINVIIQTINELLLDHMDSIYDSSEKINSNRLDAIELILNEMMDLLHMNDFKRNRINQMWKNVKDWF